MMAIRTNSQEHGGLTIATGGLAVTGGVSVSDGGMTLTDAHHAPPEFPPEGLDFTLEGAIPMARFFVDDTDEGRGSHYKFPRGTVDKMVAQAREQMKIMATTLQTQTSHVNSFGVHLAKRQQLYAAMYLHRDLVEGRRVCVFGSMEPWAEAALLALGASHVLTVEYNKLTYDHPQITTVSAPYITDPLTGLYSPRSQHVASYDLCLSISAFDHDGLGRYGDPLDPEGDLRAMENVKHLLKPETGRLLLTVPLGPDVVVWNLHRRYGEVRLPLLLQGWTVVDTVAGLVDWPRGGDGSLADHRLAVTAPGVRALLTKEASWRQTIEPVFLLSCAVQIDVRNYVADEL